MCYRLHNFGDRFELQKLNVSDWEKEDPVDNHENDLRHLRHSPQAFADPIPSPDNNC